MKMQKGLEKIVDQLKYVSGAYADAFLSIPIWTAEKVCKYSGKKLGDKNPEFLSWDKTKEASQAYKARQSLREKLDTEPAVKFLQSNVFASIPFVFAGMPVAAYTEAGLEKYISNMPEIGKCVVDSLATVSAQMVTSYVAFMVDEVLRTNRQKYLDENKKISTKKVWDGFKKAATAFLIFDLGYTIAKTGAQSYMLLNGEDPAKASLFFDSMALPAYYAIIIPFARRTGIIESKKD